MFSFYSMMSMMVVVVLDWNIAMVPKIASTPFPIKDYVIEKKINLFESF
ncbi:hypothetical protein AAEO50_06595 [Rossellomorea oryzaecorticis]|uniref:ATP synthase F0 subunit 8 n=1 Tax=Rossellomorea oryzaecorticis TaxID=1396505 RepID=A0ABU9K777_9BACI